MAPSPSDWLTSTQVAERLGCTRANVSLLIKAGKLPAERHGPSPTSPYRIRRADLDAYLAQFPERTPDMLTVTEAAAAIRSGTDAIWKALGEGRIRGERVGSRRLIHRADLVRYRQAREARYGRVTAATADRNQREEQALHQAGFLTTAEVSARLGVSPVVVRKRIRAGQLRSERIGHRLGVRPEWVDEYRATRPST